MKHSKIISTFVILIFVLAWGYNLFTYRIKKSEIEKTKFGLLSYQNQLKEILPLSYKYNFSSLKYPHFIISEKEKLKGYVFLTTDIAPEYCMGYVSEIKTLVFISPDGNILDLHVVEHYESPDYVSPKKLKAFLLQFRNKKIGELKNIDGITGATVTSDAIAKSIMESINRFSNTIIKKSVHPRKTLKIFLLIFFFLLGIMGLLKGYKKMRWLMLAISVVILGFYTRTYYSIINFITISVGKFPSEFDMIVFFVLMILSVIVTGRLYCGWLCPFGAIEEFIFSGHYSKKIRNLSSAFYKNISLHSIKYGIIYIVFIIAYFTDRLHLAGYEPFGVVFNFSGNIFLVLMTIFALTGALFFYRFYCKYLCPLGVFLGICSYFSIFRLKIKNECSHCGICESVCKIGAIRNNRINTLECIQCNECIYACPKGLTGRN